VQWDDGPHAGFTTGTPWLAVNPDHLVVNVAAQRDDPDSVLAHYRRLIALRHTEPVVVHGDFTMLLPQDERVYAFTRSLEGTTLLVLGNFSAEPVPAAVPDAEGWARAELLVGRQGALGTDVDPIVLAPWEGRVYRRS
jgi:oligo-1,6-glucosidase